MVHILECVCEYTNLYENAYLNIDISPVCWHKSPSCCCCCCYKYKNDRKRHCELLKMFPRQPKGKVLGGVCQE